MREDRDAGERHQSAAEPVGREAVGLADAADRGAERDATDMKQRGRQHEAGGTGTPVMASAPPSAIAATNAAGTSHSARPPSCQAKMPTVTIASI